MNPVLVRGEIPMSASVGRFLAIAGVGLGIVVALFVPVAGILILALVVPLSLGIEIWLARQRARRTWITDTGTGFEIEDARGKRVHDDDDVFSVEFETKNVYSQGVLKGVRRRCVLKIEDEDAPIEMVNMIKVGQSDPLGEFIHRHIEAYRERADDALREGATVQGKGWSLNHTALTISGKNGQTVTFDEIDFAGNFDGHVCVWKKGEDEAVLKVPERSQNAFLLQLLLEERLKGRAEEDSTHRPGLGRVLFERKGSRVLGILLWFLILLLGLPAFVLLITPLLGGPAAPFFAGVGLSTLVGLFYLAARANKRSVFRCHERGVYKRSFFSEAQLRYEDVAEFTYSAVRQYYNGAYIGTILQLNLKPAPGTSRKPIRFSSTVKNADEALDGLRDHIAKVLAADMLRRLKEGERVQWTPNLAITPQGIEYRRAGFIGRKEAVLLPYEEIYNFDLDQGTFHLWQRGKDKSVMQESVGQPNFFPGFYALHALYAAAAEAENSGTT